MAELDPSILKNLDKILQDMNARLVTLEQTLAGVKTGINQTFDPSALTSFANAMNGLRAGRIVDAEKESHNISRVKQELLRLQRETKHGKTFTFFSETELENTKLKLENLKATIADTQRFVNDLQKQQRSGSISNEDSVMLKQSIEDLRRYREERDLLKQQIQQGGMFGSRLDDQQLRERHELLTRYSKEYENIKKGEQQRAAELENIRRSEERAEESRLNRAQRRAERQARMEERAYSQAANNIRQQMSLKAQLSRIEHDRELRAKTGSKASQEVLDAEREKYRQLNESVKQLENSLTQLRNKNASAVGRAESDLQPYGNLLQAKENLRYAQEWERQQKKNEQQTKKNEKALRDVEMTAGRLRSALAYAFGIYQIRNFLSTLLKVRGEFEMSEVALTNIIGNVEKTQLIWKKTMNLAVNSPLSAQQLTRYTKQLAAFRIESSRLYDTTKMLGDVAVGLGVDMERLILAYGHTKSSGFLRGMYARQFATAGVNIYGELADYYSNIEGKLVTFRDVYERISKKLVTFADVEKVFEKITSKGGAFYNMQQQLTDTVQGQINKIKDSWQQALNEMGRDDQSLIRNITDMILTIVKNWRIWVSVIKASVVAFTAFKAINIASALLSTAYAANVASKSTLRLASAMKTLGASVAKNWKALIAALAAAGIVYLVDASREVRKFNADIDEQTVKLYEAQQKVHGYMKRVSENNEVIKDAAHSEKDLKAAIEDNEDVLKEMSKEYPELYKGVNKLADGEVVLTQKIEAHNQSLREQIRLTEQLKQKGFWDDPFEKDVQQYFEKTDEWRKAIEKAQYDVRLKLAHKQLNTDENLIAESILGIDTNDIELAVRQFNSIAKHVRDEIGAKVREIQNEQIKNQGAAGEGEYVWSKAAEEIGLSEVKWLYPIETNIQKSREFSRETEQMVKELVGSFELAVRNIDSEEKKITQKYNERLAAYLQETGIATEDALSKETKQALSLEAFRDYFRENSSSLLEMVKNDTVDVNETIRTFLEAHGQALTDETKQMWNTLLNNAIYGSDQLDKVMTLLESSWVEKHPWAKKVLLKEAEKIRSGMYDFFAAYKAPNGGGEEDDGDHNKTYKSLDDLLSLLKTMNSEYEKLSKSAYGFAKSQKTVMDVFRESFKDVFKATSGMNKLDEVLTMLNFDTLDITSKQGLANAFQELYDFLEEHNLWSQFGKDADKLRAKLQKTIDMQEVEVGMDVQIKLRNDFGKDIEKMFSDYELTLEMQKLDISPDAAATLFPEFDYQTLGQIQDALQDFYEKQGENFDEEDLKVYKQWSDKIDAEILKSRKEHAKEYSKYLEKEYSERAKLEMQYAKDVAFVTANFNGEQQQNILKGIEDKYQKDLNELTWKSFKESAFYVEMMDDLSSVPMDYMKIMLGKIEELLANPETLSPRALKEAINARQKILEAQMDFDQVAVMKESIAEIREAANDVGGATWTQTKKRLDEEQKAQAEKLKGLEDEIHCYEELQGQLKGLEEHDRAVSEANIALPEDVVSMLEGTDIDTLIGQYNNELESLSVSEDATTSAEKDENAQIQARIEYLQRVIPLLEAYRTALDERAAYQETDAGQNALFAREGGETSTSIGATITETKEEANETSNRLSTLKKWQKAFGNFNNSFARFNKNAADMVGRLGSLASAAFDLYDALGGETDAMTEAWKEFGNTIVNVITQALSLIPSLVAGFVSAGTTINAAMGIIGLIAEAIQLVLVLIGALAKLHDAGYEKQIQDQQKKIDDLKRAYERLEKSIEKTWETSSYIRTYNQEVQNLYERIEATNKQINAERAKKNADNDKIQDYKDSIQDMEDELEELKQTQIEVFGGIGREAYRDAASEFVDAWKSAFLETGDGLQGLQDHFDEFLQEWFVKQATMRVAGKMLEPLFSQIDKAVDQYSAGGANVLMDELNNIREQAGILLPQVSDALEQLAGSLGLEGQGSLSGLAAGIQGMTEEQANILEAYWNSVRGYTASIDMNVARIADILGVGGVNTNPLLAQMVLVANNTNGIHTLLQSVTTGGHGLGGYGIKVFAN